MTSEEKLKQYDEKLEEAQKLVRFIEESRREHINRYNLNRK
ncbi:hypothetical protein [Proteus terrae]|nr:hypothetical protein [Proteus terrae]MDR9741521.1 hypothetical protein [Proteus terrae]